MIDRRGSTLRRWTAVAVASALLLAACGDGDGDSAAGAATDLDSVRAAVVRIEAEGTFVDPELGEQLNVAGSGSGFIIDSSGIAVTNNHVVTGSALLRVYVAGESEPRNARLLGVSECSDLAVIDIDGDDFATLAYLEDEPTTGLDVYAVGFPLGDPEYTVTRGIVSKASAAGDTSWASIDGVLEHDATINPGNSGGPLVTPEGRVVGVNYAGSGETNQYFSIAAAEARRLVERLREGTDVDSIGINGQAVIDESDGTSGIWVASIASGSPAQAAGLQPGDLITRMEGLALATDGTMADFCDVLRSRTPEAAISLEVLRYGTQEVLAGQLNGAPLEPTFSFAQELEDEVAAGSGGTTDGPTSAAGFASYGSYQVISDDTGTISVEVPTEWGEIDGRPFEFEGAAVADVIVAPSVAGYQETWTTPGARISASTELAQMGLDELTLLDVLAEGLDGPCRPQGRQSYEDPLYTGAFEVFTDCGGQGVTFVVVGVVNADRTAVIGVQVQAVEERDLEALDRILGSFVGG